MQWDRNDGSEPGESMFYLQTYKFSGELSWAFIESQWFSIAILHSHLICSAINSKVGQLVFGDDVSIVWFKGLFICKLDIFLASKLIANLK